MLNYLTKLFVYDHLVYLLQCANYKQKTDFIHFKILLLLHRHTLVTQLRICLAEGKKKEEKKNQPQYSSRSP